MPMNTKQDSPIPDNKMLESRFQSQEMVVGVSNDTDAQVNQNPTSNGQDRRAWANQWGWILPLGEDCM